MPNARTILAVATLSTAAALAQKTPIMITADLSDGARKLYHAEIDLPVKAGPAAFTTPQWIPGNHRPTGPVEDITGVVFSAGGPNGERQVLPWRRDDVDLYKFHVNIPKGVTTLHAHLDCIVLGRLTDEMAVLEWEKLLLYPADRPVREIAIEPSVTVPTGWGIGTALTPTSPYDPAHPAGGTVHYAVTNVEQLEDSPVITGKNFHEFALAPEVTPKHFIDVVADEAGDENLRPALLAELSNLVREAGAMYASHHFGAYHFLLTLSERAGGEGLEHGQSSDNGVGEKDFASQNGQLGVSDLLSHEFTHSWNGKYRRPANLYQTDFHAVQQGSLLWVYEGMTQYLGNVLAARSGLKSQEQYRDLLALSAAQLDNRPGREWRSTEDTAIAASILRGNDPEWANWRRGQDYYQEGELLWLDADTLIRKQTNNAKSLNDFEHIFLGKGGETGPLIVTYTFDELVRDLKEVVPYDWAKFLHERIDGINPRADLDGIERGGYKLVYREKPSASQTILAGLSRGRPGRGNSFFHTLGFSVTSDGLVRDVRWNGPADKARLAPDSKLIAVNGTVFSPEALHAAIKQAKGSTEPIHLLVQNEDRIRTVDVDFHDGERYPALERTEGTPAFLDDITKPLTKPESAPEEKSAAE